jgi:hypothetical protein
MLIATIGRNLNKSKKTVSNGGLFAFVIVRGRHKKL